MIKKSLWYVAAILLALVTIRPAAANVSLLILGDSLSAGYGIAEADGWVATIQRDWQADYPDLTLINASISGDTTQGGLQRLPELIDRHQPSIVLIELGGNDGLRGFSPSSIKANLNTMIELLHAQGIHAAIMQIEIPPNMGRRYSDAFKSIFVEVAEQQQVPLVPFFMRDLIDEPDYIQSDGIHPSLAAQPIIATTMNRELLELVEQFTDWSAAQ